MFDFDKVMKIIQFLVALFQNGHDAGFYDVNGAPLASLTAIHDHLEAQHKDKIG